MCIVSLYFYNDSDFVLTQNRDENENRKSSNGIRNVEWYGQKVQAPIDLQSFGTWIYNSPIFTVCVLNGAYEKHKHLPPYRASRGKIIIELLQYKTTQDFYDKIDLNQIEPFTMIVVNKNNNQRKIIVWDGENKYLEDVSNQPLIVRSSSPLYSQSQKEFNENEITKLTLKTPKTIFQKHLDLRMKQFKAESNIRTTSIVQVIHENQKITMEFTPILKS